MLISKFGFKNKKSAKIQMILICSEEANDNYNYNY